jgi:hypothetical protein
MLLRRSQKKQRKLDEAQASLALAGQHAEAGRMAQASMPPPAWAPPQAWSQPGPPPGFVAPNYAPPPPPPAPLPPIVAPPLSEIAVPPESVIPATPEVAATPAPSAASLGEVPEQLLHVLEVVTNMCDHVIEYIEADRVERRLMVEALTKLAKAMGEALPPPSPPIANTERLIGGSMDPGPEPVLDIRAEPRDLETAVQVKCRFGDKWVDGFEIFEVMRDEDDAVVYRLRRRLDGVVLPEPFIAADIRHIETLDDLAENPQQQKYWSPL